jgi:hypothetical protein
MSAGKSAKPAGTLLVEPIQFFAGASGHEIMIGQERGPDGVGAPIYHYVGEQLVLAEPRLDAIAAVAPFVKFLDQPCSQATRRVAQAHGGSDRAGALNHRLSPIVLLPLPDRLQEGLFSAHSFRLSSGS